MVVVVEEEVQVEEQKVVVVEQKQQNVVKPVLQDVDEDSKYRLALHKIGGFDVLRQRPIVCAQNKSLYVVSGANVRCYSSENGSFIEDYNFGNEQAIVTVQINPENADELIVAFVNGQVLFWNHVENMHTGKCFLGINEEDEINYFQKVGNMYYFAVTKRRSKYSCKMYYCRKNQMGNVMLLNQHDTVNLQDTARCVAFGPLNAEKDQPVYCVIFNRDCIVSYEIPVTPKTRYRRHQHKFNFTCIAIHPTEFIVATGDELGQILIWHDLIYQKPITHLLHWHTQSVGDLAFSPSGTYLYSGGVETCLVQWNMVGEHFGKKSFLPRLGTAIKFVMVDDTTQMIITSHEDQSIQLIDSQMNGVKAVIEGLTVPSSLTPGLHYNSRLKALTFNGRVGHVQFYSPSRQKQLFQLDIVHQNVVSVVNKQHLYDRIKDKEKDKEFDKIYPVEVVKIAVSNDGQWMATVEYRDDQETMPEIRLKFWLVKKNNDFTLNTTIHLPHQMEITFIAFSLQTEQKDTLHLVSASKDRTFKVWDLNADQDKKWWNCSRSASLNSHAVPNLATFSSDGSLLSVLFDNTVTLWSLDSPTTIRYIPRLDIFRHIQKDTILFLQFATGKFANYLIEATCYSVVVRNVVKRFEQVFTYRAKDRASRWYSFQYNPYDNILALFNINGAVFLSIATQSVIMKFSYCENVHFKGQIVSSIFTSEMANKSKLPLNRSTFYCINEKNELYQAIAPSESADYDHTVLVGTEEQSKVELYRKHVENQLSLMLTKRGGGGGGGKSSTKSNNNNKNTQNYQEESGGKYGGGGGETVHIERERKLLIEKCFYNVPSHVLPPVDMFAKSFLSSFAAILNVHSEK